MRYFGLLPNEIKFAVSTSFHWLRNGKSGINDVLGQRNIRSRDDVLSLANELVWFGEGSAANSVPHQEGFLSPSQLYKHEVISIRFFPLDGISTKSNNVMLRWDLGLFLKSVTKSGMLIEILCAIF